MPAPDPTSVQGTPAQSTAGTFAAGTAAALALSLFWSFIVLKEPIRPLTNEETIILSACLLGAARTVTHWLQKRQGRVSASDVVSDAVSLATVAEVVAATTAATPEELEELMAQIRARAAISSRAVGAKPRRAKRVVVTPAREHQGDLS